MHRWLSTVRVRTTIFATVVVAAALVIGSVLLVANQHRSLVAGLERNARSRAADVASLAHAGELPATLTAATEDAAFTQVVAADGRVVAASRNLHRQPRVIVTVPPIGSTVVMTRTISSLDHGRFRIAVVRVQTPDGPMVVAAGDRFSNADDAIRHLGESLGFGILGLVAVVALVTWRVTGRALRPVEAIRSEVGEIGEGELHRRVPVPASHDEVGRLARTMNSMLARLDEAAERQRRFVSDASHELQSPLTSLRARFEVDLASRTEPDWRVAEAEALVEVIEMQRLVDDLLTLARLDARVADPVRVSVDLDDLVIREVQHLPVRAGVALDIHEVSGGQVIGDPDRLRRAIRNVLNNAERYARGRIAVSVGESETEVVLRIVDDGDGILVEHRERVFERFGSVDDVRTRGSSSTGLGLAITREIVEAHGGTITVEDCAPGAAFVFRFPVDRAAEPARPG